MRIFLAVVILSTLLVSCAVPPNGAPSSSALSVYGVDCKAKVVCWQISYSGLSCLPIDQTALIVEDMCN